MLVSVVMPVYNASEFLKEAILSVVNQSYDEWELICVNDGSTDNSLSIIEGFAKLDSRIKVFSQTNSGAASARKKAIQKAKGTYIAYLDADDFLSKDFLEQTTSIALEFCADTVMPELIRVNSDGVSGISSMSAGFGLSPRQVIDPSEAFIRTFPWTVHGLNLYKAELLKEYGCSSLVDINDFDSDEVITRYLLLFSKSIVVSQGKYFYRRNPSSTTQSFSKKKMSCLESSRHLFDMAVENGFEGEDLIKVSEMALARSSFLKYELLKNRRTIDESSFRSFVLRISEDYLKSSWKRHLVLYRPSQLFKWAFVRSRWPGLDTMLYYIYDRLR